MSPLDCPDWDKDISVFGEASCFHGAGWARVLHDTYGYRPEYFVGRRPGGFSAILPVMRVNSWFTGKRGVSLPFTDCCEPLCEPGGNCGPLFDAAIRHAEEENWRYLEFRGGQEHFPGAPQTATYYTHRLALHGGEEALWSGLNEATRRCIRKARKSGVTVSKSDDIGAVRSYYRLHCVTRQRLGVPPQSFAFFANIHRHLVAKNQATTFLAHHDGKVVAAAIYLHFGTRVMFKYGASDPRHLELRPNNLIMWEAIRTFAGAGCQEFHMGRNETDNPGLRRYKLGWGTTEGQLGYLRYSPEKKSFIEGSNPLSKMNLGAFRRLPIPLARLVGAAAYPHMG